MFRVVHAGALALLLMALVASTAAVAAQTKPAAEPKAKAKAPAAQPEVAGKALEIYKTTCAICHGLEGKGLTPEQDFTDGKWKHGGSPAAIAKTIREGVKGTTMLAFEGKFTNAEILELAKLVRSFDRAPKKR